MNTATCDHTLGKYKKQSSDGITWTCDNCADCTEPDVNTNYTSCKPKLDYYSCILNGCDPAKKQIKKLDGTCDVCPLCEKPLLFSGMTTATSCFKDTDYQGCISSICDVDNNKMIMPDNSCQDCPVCHNVNPFSYPSFTQCVPKQDYS